MIIVIGELLLLESESGLLNLLRLSSPQHPLYS